MYNNVALILAGGSGSRIKSSALPKQFIEVNGKPIIVYSLETFQSHDQIDAISIVCNKEYIELMREIITKHHISKTISIIPGGKTRQASSYNGLIGLNGLSEESVVLIHDAARPLVSKQIISDNICFAKKNSGVTTAIPVTDSLLKKDSIPPSKILNRDNLYKIQTPQSFKYGLILEAHRKAIKEDRHDFTDDGGLYIEYSGLDLMLAEGSVLNFKITSDDNLILFKALTEARFSD